MSLADSLERRDSALLGILPSVELVEQFDRTVPGRNVPHAEAKDRLSADKLKHRAVIVNRATGDTLSPKHQSTRHSPASSEGKSPGSAALTKFMLRRNERDRKLHRKWNKFPLVTAGATT